MDWKTTAIIVFILTVLVGIVAFFAADTFGYIEWTLNPSDLICEDCSLLCLMDECNSTEIAEVANTDEIKALICEVCVEPIECTNCSLSDCSATEIVTLCNQSIVINALSYNCKGIETKDLDIKMTELNQTGDEILSGAMDFEGGSIYRMNTTQNHTISIEINSTGYACT